MAATLSWEEGITQESRKQQGADFYEAQESEEARTIIPSSGHLIELSLNMGKI